MIGDKLASGAASATFTGPRLKFDEAEMQRDLHRLPSFTYIEKYMITPREYELLVASDGEQTNTLIREMHEHTEAIERLVQQEQKEDASLRRDCFITPFVAIDMSGRLIISRDQPAARATSKLALPRHLRKGKELLPTTGHVIDANLVNSQNINVGHLMVGKRVLFGGMSGTAVCFKNYPTWIILDVNEILGIIHKEDAEIIEEELEPLV